MEKLALTGRLCARAHALGHAPGSEERRGVLNALTQGSLRRLDHVIATDAARVQQHRVRERARTR